ncbi:MAG: flagellar basal-body rod protein FlgF, partial [Nitrospinae bacterium]|nr:flagellar basal-body rod protein FlgF [Nitrospinota bacterium]
FEKPYRLVKEGAGLYRSDGATACETASTVQTGMLETSNVNTIREMTSLITNQRTFEALQKSIAEHDNMTSQLFMKVARPA